MKGFIFKIAVWYEFGDKPKKDYYHLFIKGTKFDTCAKKAKKEMSNLTNDLCDTAYNIVSYIDLSEPQFQQEWIKY